MSVSRESATLEHLAFSRTRPTPGDLDCHVVLHCTPACSRRCAVPNRSLRGTKSRRSRRSGLSVCPHCSPDLLTARECSAPEPKSCGVALGPAEPTRHAPVLIVHRHRIPQFQVVRRAPRRKETAPTHEHASCARAASFVVYGRSVRSLTAASAATSPAWSGATRRRMQGACVRNEPDGLRLSARWAAAADLGSGGLASLRLAASAIAAAKPKMGLAFDPPVCVPVEPMRCRRRHSWREETSALRRNGESPSHLVPPSTLTGRCAPALMRATGRVGHNVRFLTALQSGATLQGASAVFVLCGVCTF